ncbi:hypothetical protein [Spirosoma aerolatum]|uniref:hypothetical protein n=1 Tax=Spirosoma aerolatum TaxID=1211326 RepID=UPI0009AEF6C8|nr:hypothetical protein [Spirosoma aerolatum]
MNEALKKTGQVAGKIARNTTFQIVVGVLAVLGFVYWIGRKMGQKEIPQVEYPNKGTGLPAGWQGQAESIIKDCYDVVYGSIVFSGAKDELFTTLLGLSDDQLVYVYNAWNARYFRLHNETLTQAIDNEVYYDYFTGKKSSIVNKMKSLKLA